MRRAMFLPILLAPSSRPRPRSGTHRPARRAGEAGKTLTPIEAVAITDTSYSPDDVAFMQGMIPHHEQALVMAELVVSAPIRPNWDKLPVE